MRRWMQTSSQAKAERTGPTYKVLPSYFMENTIFKCEFCGREFGTRNACNSLGWKCLRRVRWSEYQKLSQSEKEVYCKELINELQ